MPSGSPAQIVSFEDARRIVEEHAATVLAARLDRSETESVDLPAARGRVLAAPLIADRDFPPFPRATRDGYALRAADVEHVPARLQVIGEIKAGESPQPGSVGRGQAVSIMTGAPLPAGADAVVMVEFTTPQADGTNSLVEIQRSVKSGENFVPRAAEAKAGQLLVDRGRRLDHALIAIAASVGTKQVEVFRKPRVAVLSTGDELVEIATTPGPAQIRNSNSYSLAAQIEEAGAEPVRLPIAPDQPAGLRALIAEGLACDLLLLTGGVSMGKYDLVEQVLAEMNAEFYFTGAKIQPGKPIVFGSCSAGSCAASSCSAGIPARVPAPPPVPAQAEPALTDPSKSKASSAPHYFFGLPGNPVSTMVTFQLFAQPLIEALSGAHPQPLIFTHARLKSPIRTKTGLKRFLPGILSGEFDKAEVELARWQGSGDIATLAKSNCYVVIPANRELIDAGEWVSLLMPR